MPPATSSVTTASSMSSSDISLPSSPSPPPSASLDPYAFSSSDEINAAPPARKKKPRNWGGKVGPPRTWPASDELVLLEAVAAHKEQHGGLPNRADLAAALGGLLPHVTAEQAARRLPLLRSRYDHSVRRLRRGTVPVTDDDVQIFRLSKRIWDGVPKRGKRPRAAPHHERRTFEELQGMYPCLAAEVEAIEAKHRNNIVIMMAFRRIGDEKAAELEAKLKRQRLAELKFDARQTELKISVLKTIIGEME